jgi:ubiquinone/menaquinone biosynthesis C-methylase UbiE
MSNPFYVYEPKSACEKARTQAREKKTKTQRTAALEGITFSGVEKILDVGCGTGVVGKDLLERNPQAMLYGLDIEPSILRQAKEKFSNAGKSAFIGGDAYALPFKSETFQIVTCQYVLQHLAQPIMALAEMRRVCCKGGQAIIFEFDDRAGFSYPPLPGELQALFQAKIDLIERKGGDRSIGRKLYHHLRAAGWDPIEVKIIPDIWLGAADRTKELESAYLSFTQLKPQLLEEKLISEAVFDNGLRKLYEYYQSEMLSVILFFAAFARNSGEV